MTELQGEAALPDQVSCWGEGRSLHVKAQHPSVPRCLSGALLGLQMQAKSECFCGRISRHWVWEWKVAAGSVTFKTKKLGGMQIHAHKCIYINVCTLVCYPGG